MLTALHIQDFVLIESLRLPLGPGMTALTGETGAGKSILLEALGLAMGGRSTRGVGGKGGVRQGAKRGVVTAVYEPLSDHPVWALLAENGLPDDDDQIILKRVQEASGKGKAFINDHPVSVGLLRSVGAALLEIHGQHDGHGFLSSAAHRDLLDDFAGLTAARGEVSRLWQALKATETTLSERRARREAATREADYLRHVVAELDALKPEAGEETELAERRAVLMASEKLRDDLAAARAAFGEDGLENRLGAAGRRLAHHLKAFSDDHPLARAVDRIDRALSELMEARAAVDDASEALGDDPAEIERVEERLFALRAAGRKHGVAADRLPEIHARAREGLAELDAGEAGFSRLEADARAARSAYFAAARDLSRKRMEAGAILDRAVMTELEPLKLGRAVFETRAETDDEHAGPHGIDMVEFLVATNPGAPAGPLKSIASGGELSRFVLAMKAALAAKENRTVIIFDEVDAGVGGAVADAVGERLARLARDAQVLVVTHSPQVAARADTHWLVEKAQGQTCTQTHVRVLDAGARVEEIARMLSGATVTPEARAAAAKLLGHQHTDGKKSSPPAGGKARRAAGGQKRDETHDGAGAPRKRRRA